MAHHAIDVPPKQRQGQTFPLALLSVNTEEVEWVDRDP
jgi:hypothetical protein